MFTMRYISCTFFDSSFVTVFIMPLGNKVYCQWYLCFRILSQFSSYQNNEGALQSQ